MVNLIRGDGLVWHCCMIVHAFYYRCLKELLWIVPEQKESRIEEISFFVNEV